MFSVRKRASSIFNLGWTMPARAAIKRTFYLIAQVCRIFWLPVAVLLLVVLLPQLGSLYLCLGLLLCLWLALGVRFLHPADIPAGASNTLTNSLALIAVVGTAAFFQLSWLREVPGGYNCETLNWVLSATDFVNNGLSYVPYDWYAHNLYAYFIYLGTYLVTDEILSVKASGAITGIITIAFFFLWIRGLVGTLAAWFAASLFATSYTFTLMCRGGDHHFLMPFFESLYFLSLSTLLNAAAKRTKLLATAVAAVSLTGALHAYWGLYLLAPITLVWLLMFWLSQPVRFRAIRLYLAAGAGFTVILSMPLIVFFLKRLEIFDYPLRAFSPAATIHANLWEKLSKHSDALVWGIAGHPAGFGRYEAIPYLDMLSGTLALTGLLLMIRQLRNPDFSLPVVAIFSFSLSVVLTKLTDYYFLSLIVPLYAAVGNGVAFLTNGVLKSVHGGWRTLVFLLLAAVIIFQGRQNYTELFVNRLLFHLREPGPNDGVFAFSERIKIDTLNGNVYVPREQATHDFGDALYRMGEKSQNYAFARELLTYKDSQVFFPRAQEQRDRPVYLYFPFGAYYSQILRPTLTTLYPGTLVEEILPPPPYYPKRLPAPMITRFAIPPQELNTHDHLVQIKENDSYITKGFVDVPADRHWKIFFSSDSPILSVSIDDQAHTATAQHPGAGISLEAFLERGLHKLRIVSVQETGPVFVDLQDTHTSKIESKVPLFNGGNQPEVFFEPYLAANGALSQYLYVKKYELSHSCSLLGVLPGSKDSLWLDCRKELINVDMLGARLNTVPWNGPSDPFLAFLNNQVLVITRQGIVFLVKGKTAERSFKLGCDPIAVTSQKEVINVLCYSAGTYSIVKINEALQRNEPVAVVDGDNIIMQPLSLYETARDFIIADSERSSLLYVDKYSGKIIRERRLAGIRQGWSTLGGDERGNIFIRLWLRGLLAYSSAGKLLFNSIDQSPNLLVDEQERPFDVHDFQVQVYGEKIFAWNGERIMAFERQDSRPGVISK